MNLITSPFFSKSPSTTEPSGAVILNSSPVKSVIGVPVSSTNLNSASCLTAGVGVGAGVGAGVAGVPASSLVVGAVPLVPLLPLPSVGEGVGVGVGVAVDSSALEELLFSSAKASAGAMTDVVAKTAPKEPEITLL